MDLSDFIEPLRLLLGDRLSIAGTTQYSDDQLTSAVRSVVTMGMAPSDFAMDPADNTILTPEPNPDQFGYLSIKAALMLVAGAEVFSYRTRALSVTRYPKDKQIRINALYSMLLDLQDRGNLGEGADGADGMFSSSTECLTTFRDLFLIS